MRVAIATCERPPLPDADGELLAAALAELGASAEFVAWTDPAAPWDSFDLVLISSTWDYHEWPDEFRAWLRRAGAETRVENPPALVEWNLDKSYLRELEAAGVPVIPTLWGNAGDAGERAEEARGLGWGNVIVKPTVDLGALNLVRAPATGVDEAIARMRGPYLVQPYLPSLEHEGELSMVYLGGELSHALRKRPADGDFRVQPVYGGRHAAVEPPADAVRIGAKVMDALDGAPLYARVDLVLGLDDKPCCIELELIEPILYFDVAPSGPERLADLVVASLREL